MKREQAVLKSLIVVIALMFTTTAFAQVQCKSRIPWSYDNPDRIERVSDINRIMTRLPPARPNTSEGSWPKRMKNLITTSEPS